MISRLVLAASFALPQAEFARYHREITGRDPAPNAVSFAIDPKITQSGRDAYTIRSHDLKMKGEGEQRKDTSSNPDTQTLKNSNTSFCRITGSNERSVWYGLYDLLERRGGCRWFWDGDVVPKRESVDLSGLDVREEARFEYRGIRYFAHRGLTRFQAEHWGPADWKREIDWMLKRRLNVFMLRIGMDDLFQRTFPETCAYPDASKDLPGHGEGYDNRTLFWSLEYRGKLRERIQKYAFARGLMVPEDFGTMTHWYSRTPEDFLEKMKPPFLPQATEGYGERNGLVWDIRDDRWADAYWKLTKTAVDRFGRGRDQRLLHTIGLGERRCFTNRQDNLKLKIASLKKFLARSHRDYPNAKNLIAGWDFYFTWHPDEVRELVAQLDPKRDIIWDYEGDATCDYRDEMKDIGGNNFTKWGVVGKFPYTYSIFLAFENALDIRANYPLIEERQKVVQNDPLCAGYVFWPESSHTDTLLLRYFTANAWGRVEGQDRPGSGNVPIAEVLEEFCASRYGEDAAKWKPVWEKVVALSRLLDWWNNYQAIVVNHNRWQEPLVDKDDYNDASKWDGAETEKWLKGVAPAKEIFETLADFDWKKSPFTERDAIDLARTTADRLLIATHRDLLRAYHAWKAGKGTAEAVCGRAARYRELSDAMADLLALHADYSLAESYDRLDAVERIRNPNFARVLVENACCGYCASHQYECAEYWYKPAIREFADDIVRRVRANDRSKLGPYEHYYRYRDRHMYAKPLAAMRPALPRTRENYRRVLRRLAGCEIVVENRRFRLAVGEDGVVKSLRVKATGEEMVAPDRDLPLFAVTQPRPFNNENKLIHPNRETTYRANAVRREGDRLVVGFETAPYEAEVEVRVTDDYALFTLAGFRVDREDYDYLKMDTPPVLSFRLLQLPIANREKFGDWLNCMWDERAAAAVVGTEPATFVDNERCGGCRRLTADLKRGFRLKGGSAGLVVASGKEDFLDAMDGFERDLGLPRGVRARRDPLVNASILHAGWDLNPATAAEYRRLATAGGFRLVTFPVETMANEIGCWPLTGNYDFRPAYSNGFEDVRRVVASFAQADIRCGIHFLHPHIGLSSRYVTPVADARLNVKRRFTLAEPLAPSADTNATFALTVHEPTEGAPLFRGTRILKFAGELISYESYTTERPYRFLGCRRGHLATVMPAHPAGEVGGVLDVSEFGGDPGCCHIDQLTDLQDEIADKLAKFWNCGFRYAYFDGSEAVNEPFNYHVPNAQLRVWRKFDPAPIFAEAAAKSHFGWHMLAGANAFDGFPPERFKETLLKYQCRQAPLTQMDMTRVNFGWWSLEPPGRKTIGIQPDMWEFGEAKSIGWDCPATCSITPSAAREHPRAADVLEAVRRWERIRATGLSEAQKRDLRDPAKEHHAYLKADGGIEIVAWRQLAVAGGPWTDVRAFAFERGGRRVVAYWHARGRGTLDLGEPHGRLAAEGLRYWTTDLAMDEVARLFDRARILPAGSR